MNPLDLPQLAALTTDVAKLLKRELVTNGTVTTVAGQIILSISHFEAENRLGNLLQQIYRAIDQNFPVRKADLLLVIRDAAGQYENTFKIWKSAGLSES